MKVILVLSFFLFFMLCAYIRGYNNGVIDGRLEEKWRNKDERRIIKPTTN